MSQPPLVLHVIHHLVTGGMENGLINIINQMPASHFRHAILCIEDYSDFRLRIQRSDVEVIALNRSQIGVWKMRADIYRLCRQLKPYILHTRNMSGLDAILSARLAGVRHCVHGEHGWDMNDLKGVQKKPIWLRRLHSPLINRYITVSAHLKSYLVDKVGIADSRISQIYNGVDSINFSPRTGVRSALGPEGFCNQDSFVIGTVGRMVPVKDQASLIRAFFRFLELHPQARERARLVMIGDGVMRQACLDIIKRADAESLVWLPGDRTDVAQLLPQFDVFALSSLAEGISNTILEAMATGLPVIATAVGGNVELVEHDSTGKLVPAEDVESMAQAFAAYFYDAELTKQHGLAGRQCVEAKFSMPAMINAYMSVYDSFS